MSKFQIFGTFSCRVFRNVLYDEMHAIYGNPISGCVVCCDWFLMDWLHPETSEV
jgi:hypothetical protein